VPRRAYLGTYLVGGRGTSCGGSALEHCWSEPSDPVAWLASSIICLVGITNLSDSARSQ